MRPHAQTPNDGRRHAPPRGGQDGYALVALLALMTIIALYAMAAAPNILQQSQREMEREAIIRGEEVADAIEAYVRLMSTGGTPRLPTSMEELLEGANPPGRTKRVRVLRAYAARDPLARTEDGEWVLVQPRSKEIGAFQFALTKYLGGMPLPPSPEPWKQQARASLVGSVDFGKTDDRGDDGPSQVSNAPFVGVTSSSRREGVVNYFGISRHDDWVFTPIYR